MTLNKCDRTLSAGCRFVTVGYERQYQNFAAEEKFIKFPIHRVYTFLDRLFLRYREYRPNFTVTQFINSTLFCSRVRKIPVLLIPYT